MERKALVQLATFVSVTLTFFAVILVFIAVANLAVENQERYECEKWHRWSETYDNFYWTDWQVTQCEQYE